MPSDERYRKFAMGLRSYRVVDRRSERPGEMTLTLASGAAVASGPAGDPITPARPAAPGQYWVLHTAAGAKVPAVDVTLPGAVSPARIQVAAHPLIRCGTGRCGHCQIGAPHEVLRACQDGPVLRYDRLADDPDD